MGLRRLLAVIGLLTLAGCAGVPPAPPPAALPLLARYGWTPAEQLASYSVTLPSSFHVRAGDFPLGLYWAYSNEFSRALGFDLAPYLGQSLTATIYRLQESLPPSLFPYTEARAIVLTRAGAIRGAWIEKAGYNASALTLDRRVFTDLVPGRWGDWLLAAGVISPAEPLIQTLAGLSPEQLIRAYYQALDDQDFHLAYAALSQETLLEEYLFANKPNTALVNGSYVNAFRGWPQNILEAKLQRLEKISDNEYAATVFMRFFPPEPELHGNGLYTWFVILTSETRGLGPRIATIGTGP